MPALRSERNAELRPASPRPSDTTTATHVITLSAVQHYESQPGDDDRIDQLLKHIAQQALSPEAEETRQKLLQVREMIQQQEKENQKQLDEKSKLLRRVDDLQYQIQHQEKAYVQIEHQFFEHTRTVRATDDDLSTIRDAFKLLKYSVARIVMALNKKSNPEKATAKFKQVWPTLSITDAQGPLESAYINMLAEKLIFDHLIRHVFDSPIYPGLQINEEYKAVNAWLTKHGSTFTVRLRQQLAAIVAKSKNETLLASTKQAKLRIAENIYNDLAEIYHPFLRDHDGSVEEEKRYSCKIYDIVEKAAKLVVAMRGQDVDIVTLDTKEGEDLFDQETMVDVKGKTSGTVRLCICPPFKGGDGEHGFVEKGKVVC